ncbi:MAG: SoxR reducing system RseC family protein [Chloroflexota bacterium]|nr:SoxR reducing system RseC family protein [Lentimicrobium sp.]
MEKNVDCVIKSGVVESIGTDHIKVKINNQSACSMCYSKGVCTSLGSGQRTVDVEKSKTAAVEPGDVVDIQMISSSGWLAVLFGYVFPFILLITTLLVSSAFFPELVSALLALGILVPYFFILYAFRHRMKRYFRFTMK